MGSDHLQTLNQTDFMIITSVMWTCLHFDRLSCDWDFVTHLIITRKLNTHAQTVLFQAL